MSPIVTQWLTLFGDRPVHVRDVLDLASTDPALADTIAGFMPNADPPRFSSWLRLIEHHPMKNGHASYRFTKVANGCWRLIPS